MLYAVHCFAEHFPNAFAEPRFGEHRAYWDASVCTLMSSQLFAADGVTLVGSFFVMRAQSLEQVRAFSLNDPFNKANLWKHIEVNPINVRVVNL
ncbi:YciI family protein [Pseudomonas chlororaphis]|uniref:YciI-like protein n=1 Tax=Pseudomonas chlororaphis TaxID=587753 RepID=A0AAX3FQ21_9PSED|nr:YciI family protein [Pseudomonas chlororaphis]AZC38157.1 hypothetical protein C4K37_3772 [Pseudomonas chlororaphis subsp. piscium]AZC44703.1 hypothetical protein C4K36_3780 [Pseudomonas chlororaphis subsp. piscium]WDG70315.1 YciI family protein [Pseudomonas chlororaphis]WDH31899.1 YciI family protein [Pseudomonas chlororaphis]WDH68841.1 YciI family protein [Pseudomonas chlororaphis]